MAKRISGPSFSNRGAHDRVKRLEATAEEITQDVQDLRADFQDSPSAAIDPATLFSLRTRFESGLALVKELAAGHVESV